MKIAIVDSNNKITNVIVADETYINDERKFLSKESELWIDDIYTDELALIENLQKEIDEENNVKLKPEDQQLKKIIITAVTDAIKTNSAFTHITCYELENLSVSGSVDIQDQSFSMPLMRNDGTKRLVLFPVQVVNGKFKAFLNFPTSGQYIYTDAQANHDLFAPMFIVDPIKIDVLRKVT